MSGRAAATTGTVHSRTVLTDHLVRLTVGDLPGFTSTGVPDEWVGLVVPGQFQSRYYTVRSWDGAELVIDVVLHEHGLVTEWARTECVGDRVGISEPRGSFAPPEDAAWVVLVGDLTAAPAVARIAGSTPLPVSAWLEVPGARPLPSYVPAPVTWLESPADGGSRLAELVRGLEWPEGPGYFWMAGESAQMRDIRRILRHELGWESRRYDVMGYWSGARGRRARAVDPGPIYRRGKAEGRSDEAIWAEYDAARAEADR